MERGEQLLQLYGASAPLRGAAQGVDQSLGFYAGSQLDRSSKAVAVQRPGDHAVSDHVVLDDRGTGRQLAAKGVDRYRGPPARDQRTEIWLVADEQPREGSLRVEKRQVPAPARSSLKGDHDVGDLS